ncbi:MAG: LysR family transcriptional regulator [Burkholderiales bacterium]|nr:LysR family transcriptional regulator [Burkholderiales bacterium]
MSNLNRLTLRHLRYFAAVAGELNFRRAAERLGVSQPPLSRQIRELEDIVGVPLLERDTQRVALTAAGSDFLDQTRKLLQQTEALVEGVRARHVTQAPAFATSLTVTAPQAKRFESLLAKHLGAGRFTLATGQRSPLIAADLREGRLTAALVSLPVALGACKFEPVFADPLLAALPASHAAARKRAVRLSDLTGLPLFWWPRSFNPAYYDLLKQVLKENALRPKFINVELAQLLTLERIANGEGFTLINRSRDRNKVPGLAYRPLEGADALAIQVVFAWAPQLEDGVARKLAAGARRLLRTD